MQSHFAVKFDLHGSCTQHKCPSFVDNPHAHSSKSLIVFASLDISRHLWNLTSSEDCLMGFFSALKITRWLRRTASSHHCCSAPTSFAYAAPETSTAICSCQITLKRLALLTRNHFLMTTLSWSFLIAISENLHSDIPISCYVLCRSYVYLTVIRSEVQSLKITRSDFQVWALQHWYEWITVCGFCFRNLCRNGVD